MSDASVRHIRWDDIPKEELNPLLQRQLITGEKGMLAHVHLAKGAVVPQHSHHNEQFTYIVSGCLRFWVGDDQSEVIDVRPGEVLHIPSHVQHKAEALEDTLDLDIFVPPREDWLSGTDDYLRR